MSAATLSRQIDRDGEVSMLSRKPRQLRDRWPELLGPLLVVGVLVLIEMAEDVVRFPNPEAIYLTAVAYAAFTGGLGAGVASAIVAMAYAAYFYSLPDRPFHYSQDNGVRLAVLAVVTPSLALMAGFLRRRSQEQLERMGRTEATLHVQAEILDLAHDTVMVRDMASIITYWNKGAEEMYGFPREAAIGRVSHELLRTTFPEPLPDIEQMLLKHSRWEGELVHTRCDGTTVVVESRWALERSADGSPKAILEINNDITERKRAQTVLERQAATLGEQAELLDLAHDTIMVRDTASIITFWNKGAEKMYGFRREEAVGRSSHDLLRTVFPEPLALIEQEVLRNGRWEGELVHTTRDGARVVVASRWALQRDARGQPKGVLEINNDITERKRAERALEQLGRQKDLILRSAGEGIYGVDLRGVATFVNPAAARVLGYEPDELLGRAIHGMIHHTRADGSPHDAAQCPLHATLRDGAERAIADDVYLHKDGRHVPVDYVCTPIREAGIIVGAVVSFRDVTERRAMERMKDEFISVVSHELRTPLTSLRGSLGLLAGRNLALPAPDRRMIEVAAQSADRLAHLVDDILDVERLGSGRLTMNPSACDGCKLLEQAAEIMRAMADGAGVSLVVRPGSAPLVADQDRIIQTLTNLISNAVKFSPAGSTVTLDAFVDDGHAHFRVHDRGRGVPPDKLDTIFERFVQLDASDARPGGGTGLGLAICRAIVEQHGGRIGVQSDAARGTTFSFSLPLFTHGEPNDGASCVERPVASGCAGRRILIIDDDEVVREVAQMSLERFGECRVLTACSSDLGIALARSERPDAILLDVMMPEMDGPTILRHLRSDPATLHIPIIFLTAKVQPAERRRLAGLGVEGFIAKPFDPSSLAGEVAHAAGWSGSRAGRGPGASPKVSP